MNAAIYSVLEILSILICISYLYGKPFKLNIKAAIVISLDVILMQAIQTFELPRAVSTLYYLMIAIYCGFEYGFKIKELIINNILYMVIIVVLQYTLMLLYTGLFNAGIVHKNDFIIINFIIFFIILIVLRKCHLERISSYLQNRERILYISILFCIIILLFSLISFKENNKMSMITYGFFILSILIITLLASNLGKYKIKAARAETELKVHQLYADSFTTLIENIRMRQHEFDNHINSIYSQHFLYQTYEELVAVQKEYCGVLEKENHYNKLLSAGNSVLIGFLYGKFTEIEKQGVIVEYRVTIDKLECNLPVYKMIELLGILINNAVEALQERKEGRELFVLVQETPDAIELEVRNKSRVLDYEELHRFFEKGYSKKGTDRGLGLYHAKQIAAEYGLEVCCENKEIEDENWLSFLIRIKKKP